MHSAAMLRVVFLAIFFCLISTPSLVHGNFKYIDKLCRRTTVPLTCLHCFKVENKGSNRKGPRGLGKIAIGCALRRAGVVKQGFQGLASNSDPGLHQKAVDCSLRAAAIEFQLDSALGFVKLVRVRDAVHEAGLALYNYNTCSKTFFAGYVPGSLSGEWSDLGNHVHNAYDILEQITRPTEKNY